MKSFKVICWKCFQIVIPIIRPLTDTKAKGMLECPNCKMFIGEFP